MTKLVVFCPLNEADLHDELRTDPVSAQAREKIEIWRRDYNQARPHSALGDQTPQEFAAQAAARGASPPSVALPKPELSLTPGLILIIWTENEKQLIR